MHYAWLCFVNYLFIQCMVGLEGILRIVSIVSIITVSGTMNLIMSFVIIWLLLVPINDILLWLRQEKKKKKKETLTAVWSEIAFKAKAISTLS